MPKFIDAYQTTLGQRINTSKIHEALAESLIRDNLIASSLDVKNSGPIRPVFVTSLNNDEDKIPAFSHPLLLKSKDNKSNPVDVLATDMRLYLRRRIYDGTLASLPAAINSQVEFNFTRSRAILNLEWVQGDVESLKTNLSFSTGLFGRWIADALTKYCALDPRDTIIVAITASYYYQALFSNEKKYDEDTLQKWQIHTSKVISGVDSNLIREVFSKMPVIENANSLVEAIKVTTDNVRLKDLSLVTLLHLVMNTWYGVNSKDIIPVALEHPPTWMAMTNMAVSERTFRNTQVAKIAERIGKRGMLEDFTSQLKKIMSNYSITDTHIALASAGLA